jgi:hypothetical protein
VLIGFASLPSLMFVLFGLAATGVVGRLLLGWAIDAS